MQSLTENFLEFWFGTTDLSAEIERRPVWFKATPEFDAELTERYSDLPERGASGELDHFVETPEDCLALIMFLDQLPRNIFRSTPRAYEFDPLARKMAAIAIEKGHDRSFSYFPRVFTYLPFEHSEDFADQCRSVELFSSLTGGPSIESAIKHREAIKRFGRFPHRNAVLGRENTPEETEYLRDPPLWGMTAAEAEELERRKAQAAAS